MNERQLLQRLVNLLPTDERSAVTAHSLAIQLGIKKPGPTQEILRDWIRVAIVDHNLPIGSSSRGYYLISTAFEAQENDKGLDYRQQGIQTRRDAAMVGWGKREESIASGGQWPKDEDEPWIDPNPYSIVNLLKAAVDRKGTRK